MNNATDRLDRRRFLLGVTLAGAAGYAGLRPEPALAEPPPETTKLRLIRVASVCWAPQYMAEELLKAEGFTEVTYREMPVGQPVSTYLAAREADISMNFVGPNLVRLDQGDPVVFLAGVHVGCYEVFGNERVRKITDLKDKKVSVTAIGGTEYVFFAAIASYVGLDPRKDITWLVRPNADEAAQLFIDGRADAYIGFPPWPQELRARKIGQVILNTAADKPWSQYFCCLVTSTPEFVARHPVATKRAIRAILKGADLCAKDPEGSARSLLQRRFTPRADYAAQVLRELRYGKWREYDPEDTIRFYALRLHEAGLLKSNPQKILAQGTDWRFLNELKKELKG